MLQPLQAWITPNWPAPSCVRAVVTTRIGGGSVGAYASFNLGDQVGDAPAAVTANRAYLRAALTLPSEPLWLQQVHGCDVAVAERAPSGCAADAVLATTPGRVGAVLTADCLPLLLCDRTGQRVAAVHAGWRGLHAGVIEATVQQLAGPATTLLAWLGPAIGPTAFEVGDEVRAAFLAHDPAAALAFQPQGTRWRADLYLLARQRLAAVGVNNISGGEYCTFSDPHRFFSYRRDGRTGRMASLIWLE